MALRPDQRRQRKKNRREQSPQGPPYTVYKIVTTGDTFAWEWIRCSKCSRYVPPAEEDLDLEYPDGPSVAWPDENTFVCRRCR